MNFYLLNNTKGLIKTVDGFNFNSKLLLVSESKLEMADRSLMHIHPDKVRTYWEKTDSEVLETIEEVKNWIKTKKFREIPTDHMIEFFLTNCKYNIENTEKQIEMYYSLRKLIPEIYEKSNPKLPEMKAAWDMGYCLPLPNPFEGLYRISIIKIFDHPEFNMYKYYANILNAFEIRICEDLVVGEICVLDYIELKWSHIYQFSPFFIRKVIFLMEHLGKNRMKQMHIVRAPSYINVSINIAKKLLKKKIANRIQIHKTFDTLYDFVPQELLPSDYGGKERPLSELIDMWKQKIEDYQERFDLLDKIAQD